MAKTIPYIGEFVHSVDYPAPMRVARITVGSATTNDIVLGDTGATALFNVPANLVVHKMDMAVNTAFTASVTLSVGSSTDATGLMTTANTACTTAGYKTGSGDELYGFKFSSTDVIYITQAGATVAAGQADIYLVYSMAGND